MIAIRITRPLRRSRRRACRHVICRRAMCKQCAAALEFALHVRNDHPRNDYPISRREGRIIHIARRFGFGIMDYPWRNAQVEKVLPGKEEPFNIARRAKLGLSPIRGLSIGVRKGLRQ